jgi:hypothetical protein
MKNPLINHLIYNVVLITGLVLMIGGILTGKHGAVVVGLIVAAVDVQQWLKWNKQRSQNLIKS